MPPPNPAFSSSTYLSFPAFTHPFSLLLPPPPKKKKKKKIVHPLTRSPASVHQQHPVSGQRSTTPLTHSPVLLALAAGECLARGGDGVDLRAVLAHRQPQLQRLGAVRGQSYGGAHGIVQAKCPNWTRTRNVLILVWLLSSPLPPPLYSLPVSAEECSFSSSHSPTHHDCSVDTHRRKPSLPSSIFQDFPPVV